MAKKGEMKERLVANPPFRTLSVLRRRILLIAIGLSLMAAEGYESDAAQEVRITIGQKVINPRIGKYIFGINPFLYNKALEQDAVFDKLKEAGVTVFAVPGGNPRGFYLWYVNTLRNGQLSEERSTPYLVQQARRIGAEPIIGVNDRLGMLYDKSHFFEEWEKFFPAGPYKNVPDGVTFTADLLRYLNNDGFEAFNQYNPKHEDSYNVKWFELGSETFYWLRSVEELDWTREQFLDAYCKWFRECATALKRIDPAVKIMGPGGVASSYFSKKISRKAHVIDDYYPIILERCGDLIDVVTVHRYPGVFKTMQGKPMSYTAVWDDIAPALQEWIDEKCIKKWNREPGDVKIAVSEWSFANYNRTKANPN